MESEATSHAKKKSGKAKLVVSMILAGIGILLTIICWSDIGKGVSDLAIVGLIFGIIAAASIVPTFFKERNDGEISKRTGVALVMALITTVGPIAALIVDPIIMNVQAQENQQTDEGKAQFEARQNEIRGQIARKRFNAENEDFCATLKEGTDPAYHAKSYYFEDNKNVTVTYCDGSTKTYPYTDGDSAGTFKYNYDKLTVSDDGSYITGGTDSQKYTQTAQEQPNVEKKTSSQSNTETSQGAASDPLPNSSSSASSESSSSSSSSSTSSGSSSSYNWRQFLADYEKWMNDYVDFMKRYKNANPSDLTSMMSDYTKLLSEQTEWSNKASDLQGDLSGSDLTEYLNTLNRITQKLYEI